MNKRVLAIALTMVMILTICLSAGAVERYQVMMLGDKDVNGDTYVTEIQKALFRLGYLKSDPTGYFGEQTVDAVRAFQKAQGMSADGIVGPGTRKVLLGGNARSISPKRTVSNNLSPYPGGTATPKPASSTTPKPKATPVPTVTPVYTIDPNATPTPVPSVTPAPTAGTTPVATGVVIAKVSLTMRSAASKESSSLGEIKRGVELPIYASKGDYYRITYKGKSGYVLKSYISVLPKAFVKGKVIVEKMNLRSTASDKGTIINSFKKNEVVNIISQFDDKWYKVAYLDKIGYCMQANVQIQEPEFDNTKNYIKVNNVNMRSSPSNSASVLARLTQFTTVKIVEDKGVWLKIDVNGTVGYVLAEYVIRGTGG